MNHISTSELRLIEPANLTNDDKEHDSRSTTPEPRPVRGNNVIVKFRIRLFLFCLIEASFIILASVCLARPLPLTFGLSDSKIKGGFTVIFIVWHSLAVFAGGNITIHAFSREWSVQSQHMVPGTTDRVSTIDSGWLERTSHCLSKHASSTFRLAFLASLSLMVLGQLAPGTISATAIAGPTIVQVARNSGNVDQFFGCATRATLIIKQEKFGLTQFGLKLPANTLMSLPPFNESHRALEYNTDIVEFRHSCRWEAPSIVKTDLSISSAGKIWYTNQFILGGQGQERTGILHDRQNDGMF